MSVEGSIYSLRTRAGKATIMALTNRRQIARRHLVVNDLTTGEAADRIGCSKSHLGSVLAGRAHPSEKVREELPKLLGLPIEALLGAEPLEREYTGRRGIKPASR